MLRRNAKLLGIEIPVRKRHRRANAWTEAEDSALKQFCGQGIEELQKKLPNRTIYAIENRAEKLRIKIKRTKCEQIESEFHTQRQRTKETAYLIRTDIANTVRRGKSLEYAIARCAEGYAWKREQIIDFLKNPKYDEEVKRCCLKPINEEKIKSAVKRLLKFV